MIISPTGTIAVTQAQVVAGVVVKATPGMLCNILVTTTTAVAAVTFFDNATTGSGTVIGIVPIGATAGTVFTLNMPAINGITIAAAAGFTGGLTVSIV